MSLVQVIPLGGAGEIGKNCTVVRQDDDIVVIDCGLSFPHEEQYGVDIVIPNIQYLRDNRDKIKGIFLTHAHEDHVGALAFVLPELKVPVYATMFTEALLRSKLNEKIRGFEPHIIRIKPGDVVKAGSMTVEPILVTHSIPETCAMAVTTEHGVVLFTADFKFDFSPVDKRLTNMKRLAELGDEGVVLLLSDSTNVDRKGWGPSESIVGDSLKQIFSEAKGRVLLTTFSSNIHRMQQAITAAKETGRKVTVAGRRMDQTINLCQSMGYLKIPDGVYVRLEDIGSYAPNELVIFVTGSQGEPSAALSQMSRKEYSRLRVNEGDTILYSARPIPGNEGVIWRTINQLIQLGADVIMDHPQPIHVSGHAYQDELKMMINLTKPFYIAPVHGEPRHQKLYLELAEGMGHPTHRMFTIHNGATLCIDEQRAYVGETVEHGEVLIDQNAGYQVSSGVLTERYSMAHNGVVVVSAVVDMNSGALSGKPQIEARGFCGTKADIEDAMDELMRTLKNAKPNEITTRESLADLLTDPVRRTLGRASRQKPVVIPMISFLK